ncbi:oligosaccharide flippase family protein [Pseudolysinimonas sp.]|uniref:oligosaccharide flippase family protein n=1 Tax=Pseudolysinimonas sp. TaxID=2680009 RepID=UPI003784E0BA
MTGRFAHFELRRHGRAFLGVGLVSAAGIVAALGFQVLTGRFLGPEAYGLLAAFMAIVSIGATGSSALQNSVAVGTAAAIAADSPQVSRRRFDSSLVEALVIGVAASLLVFAAAPTLAGMLKSGTLAVILAGCTMLPAFLLARSLGILQGSGRSRSVATWTTTGQVLRVALVVLVVLLSLGAVSTLIAVIASTAVITVGAFIHATRTRVHPTASAFSANSVVVILLTVAFAWVTNIDVVLVRANASELAAGSFAAAAVVTKTIFLVPGMLALYLLPRFVSRREDVARSRAGVTFTIGIIGIGAVGIFVVLLFAAGPIVRLLFGEGYELTAAWLPWLSLAYLPWAMAQGLLIRLSAIASKTALVVVVVAAIAQWVLAHAVLPDLTLMIVVIGSLGVVVLAAFSIADFVSYRGTREVEDVQA